MSVASTLPSLREALTLAFRCKRRIVLAFLLPPILALAAGFLMTPIYGAYSKVLIKSGREFVAQTDAATSNPMGPSSTMQESINSEIEILTSRDLLLEVLHEIGIERVYPKIAQSPPGKMSMDDAAVLAFQNNLNITPVKLSNVLAVSYQNENHAISTEVLRKLLTGFINRHIQAFSAPRVALLEERVQENDQKIAALIEQLGDLKVKSDVYSFTEQRSVLIQQRERLMQDLRDSEVRAAELTNQIAYLNRQASSHPRTTTLGVDDAVSRATDEAQARVLALRERQRTLLSRFQPDSPLVKDNEIALKAAEQSLREAPASKIYRTGVDPVAQQIELQKITAEAALAPIKVRIEGTTRHVDEIRAKLQTMETAERAQRDLERQITSLEEEGRVLRTSLNEARTKERLDEAQIASVSIIEEPNASQKPVQPRKGVFLLVGIMVGLFTAGGMLLLSMSMGTTFVSSETIERVLGLPVLAVLPTSPQLIDGGWDTDRKALT